MEKTLLGIAAACCTTLAFIPQVMHSLRTGETEGISVGMYAIFTLGVALWFGYGWLQQDLPILLANGVTLALAGTILGLVIRNRWFRAKD
ncbi:SemiSWEET transporter [Motiliproteus sp.]|uniref:SemiSWEET transporter n=1 Tax=Motiliproteus sp. TaxID=1898955 RepID=UPI003BA86980